MNPSFSPTLRRPRFRHLLLAGLLAPTITFARLATEGKPMQLPTMTVTDPATLPQVESWYHTRLSSFEVLSNTSPKETRKLLADFEKFQRAVRLVWLTPPKPIAATSLILCGKENKFDAFLPAAPPTDGTLVPCLFLRNREQVAIVVDLQVRQAAINDPLALAGGTGGDFPEYRVDHYQQLYRQYVRYLLSQGEVRPPAWLEEGLIQIVMDVELSDRHLVYGKVETNRGEASGEADNEPFDPSVDFPDTPAAYTYTVVGEQPFNVVLQHRKFIPFGQFFAIAHDSPEAQNPLGNNLWAKQAYAFVHFCLFGEDLRHRDSLITFVGRLGREPLTEALFKECFKTDYAGMEKELRAYLRFTRHKFQQYDLPAADRLTTDAIELKTATADQIGLVKGDALRLAGHDPEALQEYHGSYLRGGRDPDLLAGLGALETSPTLARRFTNEAVRTGTNRPSAYVAQARRRLTDFQADPGPDDKLTRIQVASVLTPLFKARSLAPPLPETYETIAAAWKSSSVTPKPEHLAVLDEGIRRFPRDSALLLDTTELYRVVGVPATAAAVARLGLRFAAEPAARARFEELIASLPATPATKADPRR